MNYLLLEFGSMFYTNYKQNQEYNQIPPYVLYKLQTESRIQSNTTLYFIQTTNRIKNTIKYNEKTPTQTIYHTYITLLWLSTCIGKY
jgi:hypothetical protein